MTMQLLLPKLRRDWRPSSIGEECTFHQLAPYIGKLKSSVARSLIETYSRKGEVIFDPFCGSGVVPLEALRLGRSSIANDISRYAVVLTRAKMDPPPDLPTALNLAEQYVNRAKKHTAGSKSDSYPPWVRRFFHPRTLLETKTLADHLLRDKQWFLLANLLGILHHQRPGFLSYPSSHLVPYLRSKKFPRAENPELYRYRDVQSRFFAKIARSYRRPVSIEPNLRRICTNVSITKLKTKGGCDLALTSPPYMNALDYGRDNRLRLWLCGVEAFSNLDRLNPRTPAEFDTLMRRLADVLDTSLRSRGRAILVVGEVRRASSVIDTVKIVSNAFKAHGNWRLEEFLRDTVPDVRRSRRDCRGTKNEWILVLKKRSS